MRGVGYVLRCHSSERQNGVEASLGSSVALPRNMAQAPFLHSSVTFLPGPYCLWLNLQARGVAPAVCYTSQSLAGGAQTPGSDTATTWTGGSGPAHWDFCPLLLMCIHYTWKRRELEGSCGLSFTSEKPLSSRALEGMGSARLCLCSAPWVLTAAKLTIP